MIRLFPEFKYNTWLFIAILLAVFTVSAGVRYQQFETWGKTPGAYFIGERPMMTTLDAPFWLRWAREYNEGIYRDKRDLRGYPERTEVYQEMSVPKKFQDPPDDTKLGRHKGDTPNTPSVSIPYRDVPLLSYLIAHLSPLFNYNYYLTGTLLIPVLASLFILPLGVYFFWIGVPVSGLLGGLVGTFAGGYYMRSAIGRIDTDMLNLFFPVLTSLLILLAGKARTERNVLLYAIGAGFSLFLFQWWYSQSGFTSAYFMVLVFCLFVKKIRLRTILVGALLFVLCVQPRAFISGADSVKYQYNKYFVIEESSDNTFNNTLTPASFPNTLTTISEVNNLPMSEVLRRVLSNTTMDWIGFLGFLFMVLFKWRLLLPLVPMIALGLLSFQSSNRFIMYLAPFIGIGLGWLLQLGIEGLFYVFMQRRKTSIIQNTAKYPHAKARRSKDTQELKSQTSNLKSQPTEAEFGTTANWLRQGILYLGMGLFFWLIAAQTAISFVPGPSIHPRLYSTFLEVKKRVPENAALLTWWDYGYAITDATGLATFHDGGKQTSPKTYFIARGLISHDQDELYDITQYLSTEGNRGIAENNTSPEALLTVVRNPQLKPWDPIYLFFTADMTGKYGAISKLGSWDIVNGGSKSRGYQNLACNKITNVEMICRGAKIDLKVGKINNRVALRRMVFIRDGQVLREQAFGHTQGYTLQLLVAGQRIVEVQLIDEMVFRSNYNQMFLLGRYRKDLYEETYNAFPFSRLFKVKF
jgi:undecaprenyl-diphosphooligosaccharide---protein glycotransferase